MDRAPYMMVDKVWIVMRWIPSQKINCVTVNEQVTPYRTPYTRFGFNMEYNISFRFGAISDIGT